MKEYFLKLFKYNEWANARLLLAVTENPSPGEEILKLLGHIIAAQQIWLGRLLGTDYEKISLFPEYQLSEITELLRESSEEWTEFIDTMNETHFKEEHLYKNSKGENFRSTLEDVIIHIINHSTYHRAQINRILREQGDNPAVTDYIYFTREKF